MPTKELKPPTTRKKAVTPKRFPKLDKRDINDLNRTALHEAGHFVVDEFFLGSAQAQKVIINYEGKDWKAGMGSFSGICYCDDSQLTGYEISVGGWAGVVAEHLDDLKDDPEDTLATIYEDYEMFGGEGLIGISPDDFAAINKSKKTRQSLKKAFQILKEREARLSEITEDCVELGMYSYRVAKRVAESKS